MLAPLLFKFDGDNLWTFAGKDSWLCWTIQIQFASSNRSFFHLAMGKNIPKILPLGASKTEQSTLISERKWEELQTRSRQLKNQVNDSKCGYLQSKRFYDKTMFTLSVLGTLLTTAVFVRYAELSGVDWIGVVFYSI